MDCGRVGGQRYSRSHKTESDCISGWTQGTGWNSTNRRSYTSSFPISPTALPPRSARRQFTLPFDPVWQRKVKTGEQRVGFLFFSLDPCSLCQVLKHIKYKFLYLAQSKLKISPIWKQRINNGSSQAWSDLWIQLFNFADEENWGPRS